MLRLCHPPVDVGHEVHELNLAAPGARAGMSALQHDRAERTRGHDGVGARVTQLFESDITDAGTGLLFLVGKQQSPTSSAAERVLPVSLRLGDLAAESPEKPPRLIDLPGIASEVA